jgi:nucleotide-binding universal stress UspA family protein
MVPLAQLVKEEATAKLSKLVEETASRTGVRAVAEVEEGRAVSTIVDAAKRHGCDLIVLGTHGRAGLGRMVLGSVTEAVVRTAKCPVLTVPPSAD